MDPTYVFTSDDVVDPVFCPTCKQHVPRAVTQPDGLCPFCHQAQVDAQAAAMQQADAQAQQAAAQAATRAATKAAARQARLAVLRPNRHTAHVHGLMLLAMVILAMWAACMHTTILELSDRLTRTERALEGTEHTLERTTALAENADRYAHTHPGL